MKILNININYSRIWVTGLNIAIKLSVGRAWDQMLVYTIEVQYLLAIFFLSNIVECLSGMNAVNTSFYLKLRQLILFFLLVLIPCPPNNKKDSKLG